MLKNKKGFGLGITEWGSWLVFTLIIIIFFLIFKTSLFISQVDFTGTAKVGGNIKYEIVGSSENLENRISLLNYLKTPITLTIDGKEERLTFADLIINYYSAQYTPRGGEFQKLLGEKTKEFFEVHPSLTYRLIISDRRSYNVGKARGAASGQTPSKSTKETTLVDEKSIVCTFIPNPKSKESIKIELAIFNSDAIDDGFLRAEYQKYRNNEFHC